MVGVERVAARRGGLADHLPDLRARLERQRRFRLEQLAELEPLAAAEVTDAARHEVALAVAEAARHALADLDIALALIEVGDYGRCRGCRSDIPLELLRTIPTSRWCLGCRQRLAPGGGPDPGAVPRHEPTASRTPRGRGPRRGRDGTTGRRHHGTRRTATAR
ncbi:TraR/DksA family transcriptional regulator [Actinosynnema sp. NPDC059335]|uniref:TraR/DksA family transcriptional regulator n=1 Tax=Actinosynnema sp. NPDC059335 TaxID=3346804 RepID=UPI0036724405